MMDAPVMLDLKRLNKCCFGWVKFGHVPHLMPFLTLSAHKIAFTFDLDFQIILKCHKFTCGIWYDINRLLLNTNQIKYKLLYKFPGYISILPD